MSWNVYWAAYRVSEIVFFVRRFRLRRICALFPRPRVEDIIAQILERATMECTSSGLGFHFYRTRTVPPVLCAVIGRQNLKFGDGFWIWVYVEGGVGPVVHVVAAIQFPVVVLGAAAVHAVRHVAVNAYLGVILTRLADDA